MDLRDPRGPLTRASSCGMHMLLSKDGSDCSSLKIDELPCRWAVSLCTYLPGFHLRMINLIQLPHLTYKKKAMKSDDLLKVVSRPWLEFRSFDF